MSLILLTTERSELINANKNKQLLINRDEYGAHDRFIVFKKQTECNELINSIKYKH